MIKFLYTIKQQNLSNKTRYKYISSFTSRKLTHPELPPNSILTGALIGIRLASPIAPGMCSTHKATHENHAWVHVATDATQILVPTGMITDHCSNVLEGGTMRERQFLQNLN
jgi:hypothetical protein